MIVLDENLDDVRIRDAIYHWHIRHLSSRSHYECCRNIDIRCQHLDENYLLDRCHLLVKQRGTRLVQRLAQHSCAGGTDGT